MSDGVKRMVNEGVGSYGGEQRLLFASFVDRHFVAVGDEDVSCSPLCDYAAFEMSLDSVQLLYVQVWGRILGKHLIQWAERIDISFTGDRDELTTYRFRENKLLHENKDIRRSA